jgi:hypothetical protein
MLDDRDIAKLCRGRIIKASIYNTARRKDSAGPHYAIILDSDDAVKEHDSYFVAVISHSEESLFRLPVPDRTGLDGFVQCDWIEEVHLAGITQIGKKITGAYMEEILKLARTAKASKRKP